MSKYIVTPWRTHEDLLEVRRQLFRLDGHDSADTRQHAVARVMAWRLRGNLPHAVESTALLVDAFLHHDITENSSFSIRAVYSAAFCRFVTGFCDIGRSRERTLEPSSMLEIAKQIGMPVDFVSLRHEATHEELPSEARIVTACEDALHWLWQAYWSRLRDSSNDVSIEDSAARAERCVTLARKVFKQYRSRKRQSLKKRQNEKPANATATNEASELIEECGGDKAAMEAVVQDVVQEDLLIPSEESLRSSLEGAVLVWDDLLLSLAHQKRDFIITLLSGFLDAVSSLESSDSRSEAYSLWVLHVCSSKNWIASHGEINVPSFVMKYCILHANRWTAKLGRQLLSEANADFRQRWGSLFNAAQQTQDSVEDDAQLNTPAVVYSDVEELDPDRGWRLAILSPNVPIGVLAA